MSLYIPAHFRDDDRAMAVKAIREQNFAQLISNGIDGEPFVTHCPLIVDDAGTRIVGHIARANPHWHQWTDNPRVLVVFAGPHAYISPTLYQSPVSVPTWNYVTVHVSGRIRIHDSREDKQAALTQLIEAHEPTFLAQWQAQTADFQHTMLDAIVAFEIDIDRIDGKYKLGQNRPAIDRQTMLAHLDSGGDDARGVAHWLREFEAKRTV